MSEEEMAKKQAEEERDKKFQISDVRSQILRRNVEEEMEQIRQEKKKKEEEEEKKEMKEKTEEEVEEEVVEEPKSKKSRGSAFARIKKEDTSMTKEFIKKTG